MTDVLDYAPMCRAATAGADLAELVGAAAIDDGVSPDETAARHEYILDRLTGDATSAESREFASAYRAAADRMLAEHRMVWRRHDHRRLP